jgi:RNase adapter protein RapZ
MGLSAPRLVIVTGLSGAGKTVVLNALEDLCYYTIDNLPIGFLPAFLRHIAEATSHPAASRPTATRLNPLPLVNVDMTTP